MKIWQVFHLALRSSRPKNSAVNTVAAMFILGRAGFDKDV